MISQLPQGVRVPTGFATTAHAFRQFLSHGNSRKVKSEPEFIRMREEVLAIVHHREAAHA